MDASASGPATPRWNEERPFLTGRFHQEERPAMLHNTDVFSRRSRSHSPIGSHPTSTQELLVIDDLLSALVGIEGNHISAKIVSGKEGHVNFLIDRSTDLALQELAIRIFPLCENFVLITQFIESRSQFKSGLVNHALASALRAILVNYEAMVAQLEHQFRLGRLSIHGLWFYCQPMMGSMHAMSIVVEKASADNISGADVLNLLHNQTKAMAGDNAVRSLLEMLTQASGSAYLRILERWVYEGVIDDPYGEFFISENKLLQKESLSKDYDAKYWEQRYSIKSSKPWFLTNLAETILITGKYLNVMRECGHSIQVPGTEKSNPMSFGSSHFYLERIKAAYDFSSGELLGLIRDKYDLMGKLRSLKRYLLLDQGDFLVHFMDIARDELSKKPDEISVEKLQSLLDIALRTTAAAADPCHEELTCCLDMSSLLIRLDTLKDMDINLKYLSSGQNSETSAPGSSDAGEPFSITGLETFSLGYKVDWPLSLVISRKALTKYQLIFRFLFHCKHVNRQLCGAWQIHRSIRPYNISGTAIAQSSLLCRSMLKFINSLLHYLTFEVLEPNWHVMHGRLLTAKSIDEVIQYHDNFLEKCLKECLLLLPELLQKMEKLKIICLQYAAAIQRLIPSVCIPNYESASDSSKLQKINSKGSKRRCEDLKLALENSAVTNTVLNFEREFNDELQKLHPILSSSSRAEPYLTHLAQCILGVKSD